MAPPPTQTEHDLRLAILQDEDRYAAIVAKLEGRLAGPDGPITDHERRLREVEKWQWRMMGVGMCVSLLMTVFVGVSTWTVTTSVEALLIRLPAAGRVK